MIEAIIMVGLGITLLYVNYVLSRLEDRIDFVEQEFNQLKKYADTKNTHPILRTQVETMGNILKILKGEKSVK